MKERYHTQFSVPTRLVLGAVVLAGSLVIGCGEEEKKGGGVTGVQINPCTVPLVSPLNGDVMDNGCVNGSNGIKWNFSWDGCPNARSYQLYVYMAGSDNPAVNVSNIASTSYSFSSGSWIPNANLSGWRWRVRALFDGSVGDWSNERGFRVQPADSDCR